MPDISLVAVAAATLAAFLVGGTYYAVLGNQLATVSAADAAAEQRAPWTIAIEMGRCLLIALVVAGLTRQAGIDDARGGLLLGLALWTGFPLVLWIGAVIHEHAPVKLAAIHAGDWLVKLAVVAALIAVLP